jgi:hypothetical protein
MTSRANGNGAACSKLDHHVVEYPGPGPGHSPSRYRLVFPPIYTRGGLLGQRQMGLQDQS